MSQATRKVTYGSVSGTAGSTGSVFSNAATWGQLKTEQASIGAQAAGMTSMIRLANGSNVKLTSEDQSLPEGDFTIYFLLQKNDSGKCTQLKK